jgi:hypothetical protein
VKPNKRKLAGITPITAQFSRFNRMMLPMTDASEPKRRSHSS